MKRNRIIVFILILLLLAIFAVQFSTKFQPEESSVDSNIPTENSTNNMYAYMTGDQFDNAYLADMIMHHQSALNMASKARTVATKVEIRTLADEIITSQSAEVQQMMDWQFEWNYADSSDPHAGHAMESGDGMGGDMAAMEAKLEGLTVEAYDKEFLIQMILHHQQAVDMSKYADRNAKHQELKDLAREVIKAQEKEISDMKQWQQRWGY